MLDGLRFLGHVLVQLRRVKCLSQQALADVIGIHVIQIKRYKDVHAQPSLGAIKKLAMALDCITDVLVFDNGERPIAKSSFSVGRFKLQA